MTDCLRATYMIFVETLLHQLENGMHYSDFIHVRNRMLLWNAEDFEMPNQQAILMGMMLCNYNN